MVGEFTFLTSSGEEDPAGLETALSAMALGQGEQNQPYEWHQELIRNAKFQAPIHIY